MEAILVPIFVVGMLFIGLPWIIFHYVTKWKTAATITNEDEQLLDELHSMARKLDDRMETIERIMAADNPEWRQAALPGASNDPKPTLENFDNLLKKERR
ncbi:envelope stress response membrane protein PspB [Sphingorhabdus sp. Alg231-15]|uniref:envelope stress response membrane protein PspB n=1 Tax=Sphingorhabdus sp. Alg231-15 TaxID=1922222 RepID=UPI000D556E2A